MLLQDYGSTNEQTDEYDYFVPLFCKDWGTKNDIGNVGFLCLISQYLEGFIKNKILVIWMECQQRLIQRIKNILTEVKICNTEVDNCTSAEALFCL